MNILLIVVDTLRADHLGCYGYLQPTSPNLDRLAADGVVFQRCFAPGIPTTPAHTTLYTGLHPISHGVVSHGGKYDLDRKTPVLAELLQKAGYTTAAVDNLFDVKPWLARGYEFYINPAFHHNLRLLVSCEEINARAIEWLRDHRDERFFLFVHYWEPHTPYLPPLRYRKFYPTDRDPFSGPDTMARARRQPIWGMFHDIWFDKLGPVRDADYISSLYDAEVLHADEGAGGLLQALSELGLDDETMVLVMGDHGESLTTHDIYFDHHGLYEETVRVPLIVRWPGHAPKGLRVQPMVTHADLLPTICEAANARKPDRLDGQSILGLMRGEHEPIRTEVHACECTWQAKWCLRTQAHKLILSREPDRHGMPMRELYDLAADPGETRNLAEQETELTEQLSRRLEEWIACSMAKAGRAVDPLIEQGISLGRNWDQWVIPAR